ncbi:unnamed protein product, partial [marine sediment metagenome]
TSIYEKSGLKKIEPYDALKGRQYASEILYWV